MSLRRIPAATWMTLALATACTLPMMSLQRAPGETLTSEPHLRDRWLPRLEDGATRREDVVAALGDPTSTFQANAILAYRLLLVDGPEPLTSRAHRSLVGAGGWSAVFSDGWARIGRDARREALVLGVAHQDRSDERLLWELSREAEYSLVLVFDDRGILLRHALTRILP